VSCTQKGEYGVLTENHNKNKVISYYKIPLNENTILCSSLSTWIRTGSLLSLLGGGGGKTPSEGEESVITVFCVLLRHDTVVPLN
jgi:hypothetical protein